MSYCFTGGCSSILSNNQDIVTQYTCGPPCGPLLSNSIVIHRYLLPGSWLQPAIDGYLRIKVVIGGCGVCWVHNPKVYVAIPPAYQAFADLDDPVDLSLPTASPAPACSTFPRLRIVFTSLMLVISDRSGCEVVDYWVNCKGCKCLAHLDTVGVCGSNPHAPI